MNGNILGLEFVGPKRTGRPNSVRDVTISKTRDGVDIYFRNGTYLRIGERIKIAVNKNCVFFKADPQGWKLSKRPECAWSVVRIRLGRCPEGITDFIGDYDLQYMEQTDWFYVEKSQDV